jgi:hypothetical protein
MTLKDKFNLWDSKSKALTHDFDSLEYTVRVPHYFNQMVFSIFFGYDNASKVARLLGYSGVTISNAIKKFFRKNEYSVNRGDHSFIPIKREGNRLLMTSDGLKNINKIVVSIINDLRQDRYSRVKGIQKEITGLESIAEAIAETNEQFVKILLKYAAKTHEIIEYFKIKNLLADINQLKSQKNSEHLSIDRMNGYLLLARNASKLDLDYPIYKSVQSLLTNLEAIYKKNLYCDKGFTMIGYISQVLDNIRAVINTRNNRTNARRVSKQAVCNIRKFRKENVDTITFLEGYKTNEVE